MDAHGCLDKHSIALKGDSLLVNSTTLTVGNEP